MTLVVARRLKDDVLLTSDSRLSTDDGRFVDCGLKVFSVPVRIYSTTDATSGEKKVLYDSTIGMAILGDITATTIVRDFASELLVNLQSAPTLTDLSMATIARLFFHEYSRVSRSLCDKFGEDGIGEIIIVGRCPIESSPEVYRFFFETTNGVQQPTYTPILTMDGVEYFGSGSAEARNLATQNPDFSDFHIVREVIRLDRIDVGGAIQHGHFDENRFKLYGVLENITDPTTGTIETKLNLRGTDIYVQNIERQQGDFFLMYSFVDPFEDERNSLLTQP